MRVLVLGGSGHFGGRICRRLARKPQLEIIAPRRAELDLDAADFADKLRELSVDLVIHTAGPFQGQNYAVANACIDAGCHYVDLADGREFVTGFAALNERAEAAGVTLVTGASTLPGVSSSVVAALRGRFQNMDEVSISIAPAHQTPRGLGTVRAVLSYCGQPFKRLRNGKWTTVHGWHDLRKQYYPEIGKRWSGACDVPDLQLFPEHEPTLQTVEFHAALEAWWEQLGLWMMAGLARIGLVGDWSRFAPRFARVSERLLRFGSDRGGMHIRVAGEDSHGEKSRVDWYLIADNNHGPEIPCTPSIVVAMKVLEGSMQRRGAFACWNLFSVEEFMQELREFDVRILEKEDA